MGNIIKPKKYRAKSLYSDSWYKGYYYEVPSICKCTSDKETPFRYYLICPRTIDIGLGCSMDCIEIDIDTLEEIDETDEIKPCPFCGGEGYLAYSSFNDSYDIVTTVVCKNCGAEAEGFEYQEFDEKGWNEAKIKARQAWNRRI